MIVDLTDGFTPKPQYDVCVIGAGPAGISIARSLAQRGRSVFVAEGGERGYSPESQDCYRGEVKGDPYFELDLARLRFLGGTSNHWGGWCRRLDARDFHPKAAAPQTGWPIRMEDLLPYQEETRRILEIKEQTPDKLLPGSSTLELLSFTESGPPVKFGLKYEEELEKSRTIDVCMMANFVGFEVQDRVVTGASFRNYGDLQRTIKAKTYILACGCIENARLLLNENRRHDNRLGNQGDAVGRYWMEHPTFTLGEFVLFPDYLGDGLFDLDDLDMESQVNRRWFIGPTTAFMEEKRILNCGIRLEPVNRSRSRQYLADLVCNSPDVLQPLLASFGREIRCIGKIRAAWEQEPVASNRVALAEETDSFGIPRVVLHWKKTELDRRTPREMALPVARYVAEQNFGRVRLDPWVLDDTLPFPDHDELAGYHHMGGTRMAETPKDGVVDRNCRVFGTENLYVAGSSLFPSSGHANPTQTLVELALRLADHLNRTLEASPILPAKLEAVSGG
ncbi:FAD-dependent oxidoreductase [Azospirillum thermophilum]|uniref:GMC family oxidoreductase n=1 Tax=Azospirillum thermophilum TaxID=2202148 RepID=A0A2S2CWA5_9PROT|nr:GMC family oxidoreductase [Azospirillum thermophilum]AWK88695.1 GMC family oxidoreductase [Azospirillum thermophilum]